MGSLFVTSMHQKHMASDAHSSAQKLWFQPKIHEDSVTTVFQAIILPIKW